jgi:hypothetical protein
VLPFLLLGNSNLDFQKLLFNGPFPFGKRPVFFGPSHHRPNIKNTHH